MLFRSPQPKETAKPGELTRLRENNQLITAFTYALKEYLKSAVESIDKEKIGEIQIKNIRHAYAQRSLEPYLAIFNDPFLEQTEVYELGCAFKRLLNGFSPQSLWTKKLGANEILVRIYDFYVQHQSTTLASYIYNQLLVCCKLSKPIIYNPNTMRMRQTELEQQLREYMEKLKTEFFGYPVDDEGNIDNDYTVLSDVELSEEVRDDVRLSDEQDAKDYEPYDYEAEAKSQKRVGR